MITTIVSNISDAAIGIDREGRIVICNESAERLFGNTFSEISEKPIWDVLEINDFTRSFISLIKDSDPAPREQVFPFPEDRIFLTKLIPIRAGDNRTVGAVAILEDLTELHKMELTVNEFVSMVSHELKTPLTSIKGFVETLLEGAYSNPDVTKRFLQVINEETNRLTRLVISLLDLTRLLRETGCDEGSAPVNTSTFIKEAIRLFEPVSQEKGLILSSSIPDNLPMICVNADKLRQVIINLVDNALKYTGVKGAGGKVGIKAGIDGENLRIDISDTGIGITSDEQQKIFEKFYRVKTGPSGELGGTGLGLSITQEIIQSYGGEISVSSVLGEGSTFTFTIPFKKGGQTPLENKESKRS